MSEEKYPNLLYDVFLSYSHDDTEIMRRVNAYLSAQKLVVWTDETHIPPGHPSWQQAIQSAIEQSCCLVVILSPSGKSSEWIEKETRYAEIQNKQRFPILASGEEGNAIPIAYVSTQWIDIRKAGDFPRKMDGLVQAIQENPDFRKRSGYRQQAEVPAQQRTFRGPADGSTALNEAARAVIEILEPIANEHFILAASEDTLLIRALIAYENTDGPLVHSKQDILQQVHTRIGELGDRVLYISASPSESYPELHRDEVITLNVEYHHHRMSPKVIIKMTTHFERRTDS